MQHNSNKRRKITAKRKRIAGITAALTVVVIMAIGATHNRPQADTVSSDIPVFSTVPVHIAEVSTDSETNSGEPTETAEKAPAENSDARLLAKMVWGEARGCSPEEQRLVVWTVLQRVDAGGAFAGYDTIEAVITAPGQFVGYDEKHPIDTDIYSLCLEVLSDWQHGAEPPTHEIYAPTVPYYFFEGDGRHNWFREEW